ncbi:MAG TPA: hypothetical protein VFQ82_01155 [Stellaceae bacterium]|nr:hypothetical protein [Stellaceae bacterium]
MPRLVPNLLRQMAQRRAGAAATETPPAPGAPVVNFEAARQLFRRLKAKDDLVAAARASVGPQLEASFRRYIVWLDAMGYSFASCEEGPLRFDTRRVYLRYDVHVRDLFGVFMLANLHEELQIPGSFQICWEHSRAEVQASRLFLKLRAFDRRFVQFGFHCAPESGWLIKQRFDGRSESLDRFVTSGAVRGLIVEWLAAFERDGHDAAVLMQARRAADAHLAATADSFRRRFGPVRTISGHGTPLATAYLEMVRSEPRLAALAGYFHAVECLTPERIRAHGFERELTRFDEAGDSPPRILFENPIADMEEQYRRRFSEGGGFVVLFHPATWTSDHFLPFIDRVTAPGWLERCRCP